MTNASIFDSQDQTIAPATETTEANLFTALVGENQKYKTPDDLAKAYANADQFIETLKEDNRKLREQATAAKTIDDVLERMSKQDNAPMDDSPSAQFSSEDVQQLVEKTLLGRELAKTKTDNLLMADKLMKDKFGSKAEEIFKQRASSPEKARILMELAATDPIEFADMFGGSSNLPTNNMDSGSMNTTSVASNVGNRSVVVGTKEWATKVRKDDPALYWSQDFQYKLQQTVSKNPALYFGQ